MVLDGINLRTILEENPISNLYVCDLSWMLHRYYHAHQGMGVSISGYLRPTGHLFGVLNTFRLIRDEDPTAIIIMCEDGVPVERNAIMAESGEVGYKEGRAELEFNFYQDIPLIKACTSIIPRAYWAFIDDKESDDLMYALVRQAEEVETWTGRSFVHSGDNDLLQSINSRTVVIRHKDPSKGWEEINEEVVKNDERFVKKFHGVDPAHIVNFRAICGDPSDKIKGIPRFPRDIAVRVAMAQDDISQCCAFSSVTNKDVTWEQRLYTDMDLVKRNYRLMKLRSDFDIQLTKPTVKKDALVKYLDQFQINSFKNYLKQEGLLCL